MLTGFNILQMYGFIAKQRVFFLNKQNLLLMKPRTVISIV